MMVAPKTFFFPKEEIAAMMEARIEKSKAVCYHCCKIKPIGRTVRNRAICPKCCDVLCAAAKKVKKKTFLRGGMHMKERHAV